MSRSTPPAVTQPNPRADRPRPRRQLDRDAIDAQLRSAGWVIQAKDTINFQEGQGQAVREYTTDTGPADYVLFLDGQPVGVIEAKKETLGHPPRTSSQTTCDGSKQVTP